jgi:type III pantothenate kinase
MTDLLVDLGNTRLKWAQSASGCWLPGAAVHRDRGIGEVLDDAWAQLERPRRVMLVSVAAPADTGLLELWLNERWGVSAHRARSQPAQLGVVNSYRDPESLGADRWVALLGARGLTARACAIVDCGTAVTIDAMSADGVFAGGVIIPGLHLSRTSLNTGTAGIVAASGDASNCLARATADGVAAGALFGLAGAIDRIVGEQERSLNTELEVFITGGDAPQLMSRLMRAAIDVPDLVLKGLARVAEAL